MDRTACIDLPDFPLQILLRRHPEWRRHPVAVVAEDRPQGEVLWADERARSQGVLPGMRYGAALSLAAGLRAAEVPAKEIAHEVALLGERLRRFTPGVEPSGDEPGVFWLDARGLEPLYASVDAWARQVRADLERSGFTATVVVGYTRFGSYALARSRRGVHRTRGVDEERAAVRSVPLSRLSLPPSARDELGRLGVTTVGRFVDLPADGLGCRFGEAVRRLHRLATGALVVPLQPERPVPPAIERLVLDHGETDARRLVSGIEPMLRRLLDALAERGQALAELRIGFRFERLGDHVETIRPASPTLDDALVTELVRLRLQAVRDMPDRVGEIVLLAREVEATPRQLRLFAERGGRDLAAAGRALARVRARFGDDAVKRARLRSGHLPEGRFVWEPVTALEEARPLRLETGGQLVRRIRIRPVPLPPRERHEPDGWMLRGLEQGPVVRVNGPYVVSGGWWRRSVHREYHFAETRSGERLWVYYDRNRRRWFLHGRVE